MSLLIRWVSRNELRLVQLCELLLLLTGRLTSTHAQLVSTVSLLFSRPVNSSLHFVSNWVQLVLKNAKCRKIPTHVPSPKDCNSPNTVPVKIAGGIFCIVLTGGGPAEMSGRWLIPAAGYYGVPTGKNGVAPAPDRSANYTKICSQLTH